MKNIGSRLAAVIGLTVLLLALAAPVSAEPVPMRFEVPFAFLAGGQLHPAGTYYVQVNRGFNVIDLRNAADTHTLRFWIEKPVSRKVSNSEHGALRFIKTGDTLALSAAWYSGASEGYQIKPPKAILESQASGGAFVYVNAQAR